MKQPFRKIELQIEHLLEGTTSVFSRRAAISARILSECLQTLETETQKGPKDLWISPNQFQIEINSSFSLQIEPLDEFQLLLQKKVEAHIHENGLVCYSPVKIEVRNNPNLPNQSMHVVALIEQSPTDQTDPQNFPSSVHFELPTNAFFILNGSKHFPLNRPVVNIGRQLDNHLVLDDPQVSRRHAQLRARNFHFLLTDLGSKHGTYVNHRLTSDCILVSGDVIQIGRTDMIYADDAEENTTQPYLLNRPSASSPQ